MVGLLERARWAVDGPWLCSRGSRFGHLAQPARSGRPTLITKDVEAHIGLVELWIASGRPASLLYQPVLHSNNRLGVLVIGWPNQLRAEGPRATVAALLAHEVAAVIARADAVDDLADEA
jgi:hypothetical protein